MSLVLPPLATFITISKYTHVFKDSLFNTIDINIISFENDHTLRV